MKIKTADTSVTFGVEWFLMIALSVLATISWIDVIYGVEIPIANTRIPKPWVIAVLCSIGAVLSSKSYHLDRRGILIRYLGIPGRFISWCNVSQVAIAPYKTGITKALLIVLDNGPRFESGDTAYHFNYNNQHASYMLLLPDDKIDEVTAALKELLWEHIQQIDL